MKILMSKINNPADFNWQHIFDEVVFDCDVPLPVGNVNDFRFVLHIFLHFVLKSGLPR